MWTLSAVLHVSGGLSKEWHCRWLVLPDTILWALGKRSWHETLLVGNKKLEKIILMLSWAISSMTTSLHLVQLLTPKHLGSYCISRFPFRWHCHWLSSLTECRRSQRRYKDLYQIFGSESEGSKEQIWKIIFHMYPPSLTAGGRLQCRWK